MRRNIGGGSFMAKKDEVLDIMFEYLDYAKNLLLEDGDIMPTVFAHSREGTIILPVYHPEGETSEKATDLIGKVVCAYNCYEYYVVVESYKLLEGYYDQVEECINVLYVCADNCRVLGLSFKRVGLEIHYDAPAEIEPKDVEGSLTKLFKFYDYKLSELDKSHIRLMFPIQSEEELLSNKQTPLN